MMKKKEIEAYKAELEKEFKENDNFINTCDINKFIQAFTASTKAARNNNIKLEISVLERVLN